jgi:hypothetical protein
LRAMLFVTLPVKHRAQARSYNSKQVGLTVDPQ